jgi:hypothetical protein
MKTIKSLLLIVLLAATSNMVAMDDEQEGSQAHLNQIIMGCYYDECGVMLNNGFLPRTLTHAQRKMVQSVTSVCLLCKGDTRNLISHIKRCHPEIIHANPLNQ